MEQAPSSKNISRRLVTTGTAWAAPAIALTAAAPAFAASRCSPTIAVGGGVGVYWGASRGCQALDLNLGGAGFVCSLPAGVTVQQVDITWRVQRREGQDSHTSGIYYPANSTASLTGKIGQTNAKYTLSAAQQAASAPGWDPYVIFNNDAGSYTFTNPRPGTYPTAATQQATQTWTMSRTWRAGTGAGTYQSGALGGCGQAGAGCTNFSTGETGTFTISYNNLSPYLKSEAFIYSTMYVTVRLSDGTTLQRKTNDEVNHPNLTATNGYYATCTMN